VFFFFPFRSLFFFPTSDSGRSLFFSFFQQRHVAPFPPWNPPTLGVLASLPFPPICRVVFFLLRMRPGYTSPLSLSPLSLEEQGFAGKKGSPRDARHLPFPRPGRGLISLFLSFSSLLPRGDTRSCQPSLSPLFFRNSGRPPFFFPSSKELYQIFFESNVSPLLWGGREDQEFFPFFKPRVSRESISPFPLSGSETRGPFSPSFSFFFPFCTRRLEVSFPVSTGSRRVDGFFLFPPR